GGAVRAVQSSLELDLHGEDFPLGVIAPLVDVPLVHPQYQFLGFGLGAGFLIPEQVGYASGDVVPALLFAPRAVLDLHQSVVVDVHHFVPAGPLVEGGPGLRWLRPALLVGQYVFGWALSVGGEFGVADDHVARFGFLQW